MVATLRRNDESVLSFDVWGTALDSAVDGEYLIVAGHRTLTLVCVDSPSGSWPRLRTNRQIVRQVRCHPARVEMFACVAGQDVDIYALSSSSALSQQSGGTAPIQRMLSFTAHSRRVSDFNWCPLDANLMVSCAEQDAVSFWDLRDCVKPVAELGLVFGAGQAKFAPHVNHILVSSHGCDLRIWDLRNTAQPMSQFSAHRSRINCLAWHPLEANCFASSGIDGFFKVWELPSVIAIGVGGPSAATASVAPSTLSANTVAGSGAMERMPLAATPSVVSMAQLDAWRFAFAPDGEELATLSLPANANASNSVSLYANLIAFDASRTLKRDDVGGTVVDMCWWWQQRSPPLPPQQQQQQRAAATTTRVTKFIYTLSKRHRLCRHPVAYEPPVSALYDAGNSLVHGQLIDQCARLNE